MLMAFLLFASLSIPVESTQVGVISCFCRPSLTSAALPNLTEGNMKFISKWPLGSVVIWISSLVLYTPAQGAYNSVIAAASPAVRADPKAYKAGYLMPIGKLATKTKTAQSEELAAELWTSTEMLLREMEV